MEESWANEPGGSMEGVGLMSQEGPWKRVGLMSQGVHGREYACVTVSGTCTWCTGSQSGNKTKDYIPVRSG